MSEITLQSDLDARATALAPDRSFIVQAPAGSGKTELLIQRFLTLLGHVNNPEEVLAITFTNKAAAEMRHRVLLALEQARSPQVPDEAHLQVTRRLAQSVLQRDTQRGWNLAENAGRLRIQTLDAFNAMLARMEPLTASVSTAGAGIPADADLRRLYRDAAAATLDSLAGQAGWSDSVAAVLTHTDCNVSLYVDRLADMLTARDQWLPLIGGSAMNDEQAERVRQALQQDLAAIVGDSLHSVARALPAACESELLELARFAAANLHDSDRPSEIRSLLSITALPAADCEALEQWRGIAELLLKKDGHIRISANGKVSANVAQGFPPGKGNNEDVKMRLGALLETLAHEPEFVRVLHDVRTLPEPRYPDDQWQVLRALLDLLKLATVELQRLFRANGATDYIEVSLGARAALGDEDKPTDLGLLLDYRINHILVDEVQDTSVAQYRMLERLVAGWSDGDGRTLFCVGDPMQSIYRFRNAEVAQFLVAREQGIAGQQLESLTLRQNFRSGDGLVDWFNRTFDCVMPDDDDPPRGAVSYADAVSPDIRQGYGEVSLYPVLGSSERQEAAATVSAVRALLDNSSDERVVILVRTRTQLRELVPALRDAEIRFNAVDIDTLTELPEIIDLLSLTRAIADPGDRHAWLGLLRAPWIGLSFADMVRLVDGQRRKTILELIADDDRLSTLSKHGQSALRRALPWLRALRQPVRAGSLRSRVESAWMSLGGPVWLQSASAADNVHHFFEVLGEIETCGSLADIALLASQLDAEKVSSVAEGARVEIMTMHKSKGLQFDHVVLHGLGRTTKADSSRVLNWIESTSRDGRERLLLAPVGRSDSSDKDPIHAYLALLNKEKSRFELQRLLYVACTRAKRSLHLVGHVEVKAETDDIKPPPAGTLLSLLWPLLESDYELALSRGDSVHQQDANVEWLVPALRRLPASWTPPSVDFRHLLGERSPLEETRVRYEWAGSDAKITGTLVHRWLQAWTDGRLLEARTDVEQRDAVSRRWLQEDSYEDADSVVQRVNRALHTMQADERGRWLLSGDGFAELTLTGSVGGDVVTGIIDRVRIDADTHWVVDYKTSDHEGGNRAFFLDEEVRRYREQLSRYVQLYEGWSGIRPKAALYFPLMGEFVEVDGL
ncbi:MAG: UvrD-helicase domain-containing protein [Pseudomonadota bacterium]